jgi:hypothetical protein
VFLHKTPKARKAVEDLNYLSAFISLPLSKILLNALYWLNLRAKVLINIHPNFCPD